MEKSEREKNYQKNIKFCNKIISVVQKNFYDCSLLNNLLFMIIKFIVIKFKLGCKILIAYFRWNIITKVLLLKIAIMDEIIEFYQKLSNSSVLQGHQH